MSAPNTLNTPRREYQCVMVLPVKSFSLTSYSVLTYAVDWIETPHSRCESAISSWDNFESKRLALRKARELGRRFRVPVLVEDVK